MPLQRRKFLQSLTMASFVPFASTAVSNEFAGNSRKGAVRTIKPKKLSTGQTIGVVSPSGAMYEAEPYELIVDVLQAMGLRVKMGQHVSDRYGHLAGKDDDRAEEINNMFGDKEVDAIICLRGGSGAARILDKIDYKVIVDNPKIFIGYSDITALLLAIYAKSGLITFHGPVAISSWNGFTYDYFKRLLFEGQSVLFKNPEKSENELVQVKDRIRTLTPGNVSGTLMGGNLSVLCGLVGSDYLPSWKGKILFLEDTDEKIYRIDRMMSQLQLSGVLKQIKGFVMGKCTNCNPGRGYGSLTLDEILDHYIKPLKIPAFSGAMIGHIEDKFTIPVGMQAQIDADAGSIQLLDSAVI